MVRILCVGNRLYAPDAAGPLVYRTLRRKTIPRNVELIEAGLGGLDLLPFFEGCSGVVLVDRVAGFSRDGEVVLLARDEICGSGETRYDHSGGLVYLLRSLPALGINPELVMVGIEGEGNDTVIGKAAKLALEVAHNLLQQGKKPRRTDCGKQAALS